MRSVNAASGPRYPPLPLFWGKIRSGLRLGVDLPTERRGCLTGFQGAEDDKTRRWAGSGILLSLLYRGCQGVSRRRVAHRPLIVLLGWMEWVR